MMVIALHIIGKASSNFFIAMGDRFNELESGFGNKSKRCWDMVDDQPLERKKFNICQDNELLEGASTSGIAVGCFEFDQ